MVWLSFCFLHYIFFITTVLDHICHHILRYTKTERESQMVFNVKYMYLIKKEQYWALDQSPETEQTWTSQQTFKKTKLPLWFQFQLQKPSLIFIKTFWKVSITQNVQACWYNTSLQKKILTATMQLVIINTA